MKVLFYLLESNLYLLLLYGFYRALLHRETFHQMNRWYLLAAIVLAFTTPLLKVNFRPVLAQKLTEAVNIRMVEDSREPVTSVNNKPHEQLSTLPRFTTPRKTNTDVTSPAVFNHPVRLLLAGYLTVTLFCLLSTFAGLLRIIKLVRRSPTFSADGVTHVLLEQEGEVFSFFNWLFYHPAIQPQSAIIAHELVHIRQKHSLDLLLFDLVRAISWFNPVLYIMRRDMKLNHEYLADEQASRECINRHTYALLLIDHSCSKVEWAMAHQMFSAGQLKARILRLSKQRSAGKAKSKYMLALPLLAVIVCLSAFTIPKDYGLVNLTIIDHNILTGPVRMTPVPVPGIRPSSDTGFDALQNEQNAINDEQKPANPSAVAQLPVAGEQNIVPASVIKIMDTVPSGLVTTAAADSLRNKSWAPRDIRDSVRKYEGAVGLFRDSMLNDGYRARQILNLIQEERSGRYHEIQDSTRKAMGDMSGEGRIYHSALKDVPDQPTKDRRAYVDILIRHLNACYAEMQRLIQATNALKSQVRDSFPMYVDISSIGLYHVKSLDDIDIPVPDMRYRSAWVKNETERLAFFANSN